MLERSGWVVVELRPEGTGTHFILDFTKEQICILGSRVTTSVTCSDLNLASSSPVCGSTIPAIPAHTGRNVRPKGIPLSMA